MKSEKYRFGVELRRLRLEKEMTLRDFCISVGAEPSFISNVTRGIDYAPEDRKILEKWAEVLGADKEWFINLAIEDNKNERKICKVTKYGIPLMLELKNKYAKDKEDVSGITKCPACGKKIGFVVHSFNKHVWLKCETDGCLSIIQ